MAPPQDSNEIKLPDSILSQIDNTKYENDERFVENPKKRKQKPVSRKEKRANDKELKKQKRSDHLKLVKHNTLVKRVKKNDEKNKNIGKNTPVDSDPLAQLKALKEKKKAESDPLAQLKALKEKKGSTPTKNTTSDPLAQLKALKEKKNTSNTSKKSEVRIVKEDDLEDDYFSEDDDSESDPIAKLMALKQNKNKNKNSDVRVVKENDLSEDDDFSDFDEDLSEDDSDPMAKLMALKQNKKTSDVRVVKEDDLSEDDNFSDIEEESDPLAKLKALKEKKNNTQNSEYRVVKEDELMDDDLSSDQSGSDFGGFEDDQEIKPPTKSSIKAKKSKKPKSSTPVLSLHEQELLKRDEDDIAYYAKKLGLKSGVKSKLSKIDEFDEIGGLLDGLEFDYEKSSDSESESENESEYESKTEVAKPKKKVTKSTKSEPRAISKHDQELLDRDQQDIEYYAKKLGLKNGAKSKLTKTDDDDEIGGLLDGLDLDFSDANDFDDEQNENLEGDLSNDDFDEDDEDMFDGDSEQEDVRKKENPFVAPVEEDASDTKYIPPALRRKMALEASEASAEVLQLRKEIKGPLNKLSEANISAIVNDINGLFLKYPRQIVNEELTTIIIDGVTQQGRLLDMFVYLRSTLIVAIHRLQGAEFGPYFVQTLVEKFEEARSSNSDSKVPNNIISLLSTVYLFQLISSKLIYDIVNTLIKDLNEQNADLLLKLIRSSGNQMRTDDPNSLKDIVVEINSSLANVPLSEINARTQFLIETIAALKNNKLKMTNEANHQLSIRLKKFLGSIKNNKFNDPIQVSLEDIKNVESRGKWWLVGSAWKGHVNQQQENDVNEVAMNDILDQADPNWMELARAQRMNTDIRRAIFVSIMSAQDYIDAVTKLDKLALKRSQEREIPRVLIQCAGVEPAWNPYYGILAKKLCDQHSYRKTFQFMLWDMIKEFEGVGGDEDDDFPGFDNNDIDDDQKLKRILNLGRFYGFLISEGCLPLHILKTVNFVTANNDTILFLEVLFVTLLDKLGKKCQVRHVGMNIGSVEMKFEDKLLIELIFKAKEQKTLLHGIQYFLLEKIRNSNIIDGKKQRKRVEWGIDAFIDVIDELLNDDRE